MLACLLATVRKQCGAGRGWAVWAGCGWLAGWRLRFEHPHPSIALRPSVAPPSLLRSVTAMCYPSLPLWLLRCAQCSVVVGDDSGTVTCFESKRGAPTVSGWLHRYSWVAQPNQACQWGADRPAVHMRANCALVSHFCVVWGAVCPACLRAARTTSAPFPLSPPLPPSFSHRSTPTDPVSIHWHGV